MDNFLDFLSIYNAKAAVAISIAVSESNSGKANMMSSLKTTANDLTLSEEVRLNALTALINLGNLLDIPLPPYFPSVTTYALTETFVGVHNDLDGIQGGAPGEYYHLTDAERTSILNKANVGDITWANLGGVYSQNVLFAPVFDAKQNALSAPAAGTYFVKVTGNTVSYDSNSYISNINSIAAGGELEGTYPNPTLSNAAVIGKLLTGFDPLASTGSITDSDTILSAIEKLNANIDNVIANPSGVSSVAFTNNAALVFTTTASPSTGAASLSLSLNTQNANLLLASPNGTNGLPLFRSLVAADLPNSGVTAATYGSSTVIPQIQVDAKGRITSVTAITAASGGQVNTITLAVPSFLSPSNINNTLPASPEIVLELATQAANTVFAGPISGASVVPAFRSLVEDDIPQLSTSKITNLTNILDGFLTNNLSDGSIWIGNTSNAAVQRVLSGDVTVSNTGVTAIGLAKVQYDMIQDVTTQTLLGRYDAVDGEVEQVTLSGDFLLNSSTGVLSLSSPVSPVVTTKGDLLGHDLTSQARLPSSGVDGDLLIVDGADNLGLKWVTAQGDVEVDTTLLDGTFNIKTNAVTLGKIAQIANNTVLGNVSGALGNVSALSTTQLTTLVNQFGIDTSGGNTGLKGVVPGFNINGLPAGKITADYFLNASGAWSLGGGGGGTTTFPLTIGSGLSGTAATFNGSAGVTISLNTANANTWTALQIFENNIYVGLNTGAAGSVRFRGSTSGYVILQAPASPDNKTYILPATNGTTGQFLKLSDSGTGQLAWDTAGSGSGTVTSGSQYQLAYYNGAGSTTSVTGLTSITASRALVSDANGLPVASSVSTTQLQYLSSATGTTGTTSTNLVFDTSPTLITPILGVASATSINKVAITAPGTSATLTIADGKTFTSSNTLTLTGTDGSSVAFGAGGTVAYVGASNSWTAGVKQTFAPNATNAGMNVGSLAGDPSSPVNGDLVYNTSSNALRAYINGAWVSLGSGGGGGVTTFQTSLSGLLPSTATTGAITLSGTLGVASGGTGAVTLTGLLRGTGTTAITGSATVALGSEVSGTLPVGNGGTGITTNTAYAVVLGGTTNGGVLTQVASLGSSGQVLTSNGAGAAPTFQTGGGSVALNNVLASTGSSAGGGILNTTSTITWNWNSNTTTNAFVLNSTNLSSGALLAVTHSSAAFTGTGIVSFASTAVTSGNILSVAHTTSSLSGNVASFTSTTVTSGAILNLGISGSAAASAKNLVITNSSSGNTSGRGIDVLISGTTASATTYGAYISNTKVTGTAAYALYLNTSATATTNYGLQINASGGTTNYAIDVVAGISRFGVGTASVPQMILTPSSALTFSGTVDGSIWYDTTSFNSSIVLRKLYASGLGIWTKVITKDYNQDFATGTSFGVIVADTSGTLTKSADLTALGVLATYSTYTVTTSATNIFSTVSLTGSTGLPANFFAVGKTIIVVVSGQYTSTSGSPTLPLTLAFGTYSQAFTVNLHTAVATASLWEAKIIITCSAAGASGALRTMAQAVALDDTANGTPKFSKVLIQTASSFDTTSASTISLNASYVSPATTATIDMCQITYLN